MVDMKHGVVTLRSLELAGFKSFAKRTKLEFGAGLVAIVGPNGSGKSNVVDAIKWVFGEQKNRSLRTDRAEELIYHGGDGKSRASMAEVVIRLDNSAGRIPVELSEIEITRRLYRSGESNYLLNGKKVSLGTISELLAKSGFGVGSYTVVGQGLIERLILATGLERKQLFEEASGIKQFEIKQSQTKKNLDSTQQNLTQINSMIAELKSQNEILARQVGFATRRTNLAAELEQLRYNYLSALFLQANSAKQNAIKENDTNRRKLESLTKELTKLEKQHDASAKQPSGSSAEELTSKLRSLEAQRDNLEGMITKTTVELEQNNLQRSADIESIRAIQAQIKQTQSNLNRHHDHQQSVQKQISKYEDKISVVDGKVKSQTKLLDQTRNALTKTQKTEYLRHSLGLIDVLQSSVEAGKSADQLNIIFYKLRRMIRHSIVDNAAELALKVGRIQNSISRLLDEREKLTESQTNEVIRLRASEMDEATVIANLKELQKKLKALQSNTVLLLNKKRSFSGTSLAELEKNKTKLLEDIASTQSILAELANQTSGKVDADYFGSHEKLTNQSIVLKQAIVKYEEVLDSANADLNKAEKLKQSWYGNKTFKTTTKPLRANIDKIRSIEAELNLLDELNPTVEKDYSESKKRMEFLIGQAKDLSRAIQNLQSVYAKTEVELQKSFKAGFNKINNEFGKSFKSLFGGGEAKLQLNEEEGGYGIEIIVRLPNKREQNLSSLSGGEKALASAALLAAILEANPSPFIVLDEVDAALDERNTQKFAQLLTVITKHSQVLVVTHNHDTMAVADELLGVTTAGNNESHIIRVKLDSLPKGVVS